MDFYAIVSYLFPIAIVVFFLSSAGLLLTIFLYFRERKRKPQKKSPKLARNRSVYVSPSQRESHKTLANGYTRQEYHEHGFTDNDIDCWGLDQPGAPPPDMAIVVLADMADGNLDGNFDIFPDFF